MKKPVRKTLMIAFVVLAALFFISWGAFRSFTDRIIPSSPTPGDPSPADNGGNGAPAQADTELHLINGVAVAFASGTLTLNSYAGTVYGFATAEADLETGKDGVITGSPVSLYYYGALDDSLSVQDVRVETVLAYAADENSKKAHRILDSMSREEKVGQMFIVRCPEEEAAKMVSQYHLGGYILFGADFGNNSKSEVIANIRSYQEAAAIPLLIGVDEEGGVINRISVNKAFRAVPFWSPQDLYAEGGWDLIISDTKEKAELLESLGININLAPVCDISIDQADYIFARSFGRGAELTSQYVLTVVQTMKENGMGSVLKHFPGYGNNKDTHKGFSYDDRSYDTFVSNDFLPFTAGIRAGAGAVLVSHNIVTCMDTDNPASLSPKVHQILRHDLGFEGVIMTDDLYMDAIRSFTGSEQAAVKAVLAGNDLICSTDFEVQIPAVIAAVNDGAIAKQDIDRSVMRILCWKLSLSVIE